MLVERLPWVEKAACRGMPTEVFFPEEATHATTALARSICAGCPVQFECREFGRNQHGGVWGGVTKRNKIGTNRSRTLKREQRQLELEQEKAS